MCRSIVSSRLFSLLPLVVAWSGCGEDAAGGKGISPEVAGQTGRGGGFALASVVIQDTRRTTYVQVVPQIPVGHVDNSRAIEIGGNAVMLTRGRDIFIGLAEEPVWVRYSVGADGTVSQSGRLSFAGLGLTAIDYGNVIVDASTAVSVSSAQALAIVWNPTTLEILGTVDLPHLKVEGYEAEVWTTVAHGGRVYIPGRWANWDDGLILPRVVTAIVDPAARKVVGIAEDDRCASGGRVVIGKDGYAYVMGDGRNYSIQMFANAAPEPATRPAPRNCLLRIAPGALDFEAGWMHEIPALTGGLESATELETAVQGSGYAFTKLFYPDQLPAGVAPVDFDFWEHPVFKTWRLEVGDQPRAVEVTGAPFSSLGFSGSSVAGKLYGGAGPDNASSVVYEIDPGTNAAGKRFTMDGLFYGLAPLE